MKKLKWPGGGWKVACHKCGFWYSSQNILKEWTGLLVCPSCYESRHPQTLIKLKGETAFPEFVSKDGTDSFLGVCDIATSSGYADLGRADCMQADNNTYAYHVLAGLQGNGHI